MNKKEEQGQELEHITDKDLAKRAELPESEWEERPEGMTIGEWFRLKRSKNNK